jgi:hypothetical protein
VAQAINTKSPATGVQKQEETDVEDMDSDEGDDYKAFDEDDHKIDLIHTQGHHMTWCHFTCNSFHVQCGRYSS